jgi:thymidylate kinase
VKHSTARRRVAGVHATRDQVMAALVAVLDQHGSRWAWQGARTASERWTGATDAADLDLWCDADTVREVAEAIDAWPAARVADAHDPRRLRHVSHAVETEHGLAVLDVTFGDLRVGAVLLVPGSEVTADVERLTGVAAAADLLLRPLLRGRVPDEQRIEEARAGWANATDDERRHAERRWSDELSVELAPQVVAVLAGGHAAADLASRCRRELLRRTLAPSGVRAAWSQRHAVLPAGRAAGPLGLRTRGVVVVLVGTDGSGKSTVAAELSSRLERAGFGVRSAYFGMARGNLPGVGLARRILGVAPAGDGAAAATDGRPSADDPVAPDSSDATMSTDEASPTGVAEAGSDDPSGPSRDLDHPGVRRLAAWYYAGEYVVRYLTTVSPGLRRRQVVVCDRYVYDLRESPWPGSMASRFLERVIPAPDVLVLPDAPVELIHARKPERSFADQSAQQQRFRALLESRPARVTEVRVDTSGDDQDGVADVVAAVVTAAHRARRHPR